MLSDQAWQQSPFAAQGDGAFSLLLAHAALQKRHV